MADTLICERCKNKTNEILPCEKCEVNICDKCNVPYNQFTQVDYTLCKDCGKTHD